MRMGDGKMRTYSLPLLSPLVIGMGRPVATHGLSNKPKNIQIRLKQYTSLTFCPCWGLSRSRCISMCPVAGVYTDQHSHPASKAACFLCRWARTCGPDDPSL